MNVRIFKQIKETNMKKVKMLLVGLGVLLMVIGAGYVDYKIWRAEHPQAATWTYFVSNN